MAEKLGAVVLPSGQVTSTSEGRSKGGERRGMERPWAWRGGLEAMEDLEVPWAAPLWKAENQARPVTLTCVAIVYTSCIL